jgi:hypothetical protein
MTEKQVLLLKRMGFLDGERCTRGGLPQMSHHHRRMSHTDFLYCFGKCRAVECTLCLFHEMRFFQVSLMVTRRGKIIANSPLIPVAFPLGTGAKVRE